MKVNKINLRATIALQNNDVMKGGNK